MGIIYDYFRAPGPGTAIDWSIGPGGDWRQHTGTDLDDHGVDWIDCKGIDTDIVLGQLVAFASDVPLLGLSRPTLVWPDQRAWPYGEDGPGEDTPWDAGLILRQLPDDWAMTLARISDDDLPELALRWRDIDEFDFADAADARARIVEVRALARRAGDHGHGLYCMTVV